MLGPERRFGRNKKQELASPSSPAASATSHASSGQSAMSACSSDDIQPFHDDHASTSAASADLDAPAGSPCPDPSPSIACFRHRYHLPNSREVMRRLA